MRTIACLAGLALAAFGLAWKPSMHLALAEIARLDAIDDGFVSIEIGPANRSKLRFVPGTVYRKPSGVEVLRLPVDPELREALRLYGAYYRAGTMGPDAYPDIVTGQMTIHTDVPTNAPGGTNAWLEHVWRESLRPAPTAERLRRRAFAAGYLTHGAGDMFGHSYVNHYAGGDFDMGSTNFLRHIVLEGYVARRGPKAVDTSMSIVGIERWLYSTLVDARAGTVLADRLYKGEKVDLSIPYRFSKLRDRLAANVDDYERHQDDVLRQAGLPLIAYQREWIRRIDLGLQAWPAFSHEVATRLVLYDKESPTEFRRKDELVDKATDFMNAHGYAMLGAPGFVGDFGASLTARTRLIEEILELVISDEEVEAMKTSLLDSMVGAFTNGMTYDAFKEYAAGPQRYFDSVLSAGDRPRVGGRPRGEGLSLATIHAQLGLADANAVFSPDDFAPAYNTVVMSKLILVSAPGVATLRSTLGVPATVRTTANPMLGYVRKFDGSAQWTANFEKMFLEEAGVFGRVFRDQEGAEPEPGGETPIPKTWEIAVKVTKVRAVSGGIDPVGEPDFYARITIDGDARTFDAIDDDASVSPSNWSHKRSVTARSAAVRITIYDEDGNAFGADDLCDAAPNASRSSVRFTCGLSGPSPTLSGDVTGSAGRTFTLTGRGDDAVEVTFTVTITQR